MARRSRGTGSLTTYRDSAGAESWYGLFYSHGRRVKRRICPNARQEHGRDSLAPRPKLRSGA